MKILIPFTPHIAYECLKCWVKRKLKIGLKLIQNLILKEKLKLAIQINGKTRDIIEIEKGINQITIEKLVQKIIINKR